MLVAAFATALSANAGNTTLTAKLDSAHVMMGKTVTMHLEIVQDRNVNGLFMALLTDTLTSKVEIAEKSKGDTTACDNNRIQINYDFFAVFSHRYARLCQE